MRAAEGGFHHEVVRVARLAGFGAEVGAQFEVAGVEQRFTVRLDEGHGAAEDVAGGEERKKKWLPVAQKLTRFAEAEDMFRPFAAEAMAHEPGGRFGEDRRLVRGDVIAVRVTDEDMARLGPMRIEPQAKAGQVDAALMIFEGQRRHAGGNWRV